MNVLQINIRATQGGAGRLTVDLHRRLQRRGVNSRLLYGYGSGIADDPMVAGDATIERTGTRAGVLGNYAWHRLFGRDIFTPGRERIREGIAWADIVHVHAPHHYFLNWEELAATIRGAGKPIVMTAHDWWYITGRCPNTWECTGWRRQCGECGTMRSKDLPSLFDLSRGTRVRRMASLRSFGDKAVFACPSQHLANDYAEAMPWARIEVVPNGADLEFERCVAAQPELPRDGILFSASDLSGAGKVDLPLLEGLARSGVASKLVGRNNPFDLPNCAYLGEVRERARMVEILKSSEALMFCSRMDNAPLTILEALIAGCYVVAFETPAAAEMIEKVGGRCVADREEALAVLSSGAAAALYGGLSRSGLARRAHAIFSGETMTGAYLALYARLLGPASADAATTPADGPAYA